MMRARQRGFTLIELLVVAVVISIMMAIAVPSFVSFISNYRASTAINDFLQGVNLTRNEALKGGRRALMLPNASDGTPSITGDWRNGWSIFVDLNNNEALDAAENLVFRHDALPTSITLINPTNGATAPFTNAASKIYVSFDGTGYPRVLTTGATLSGGITMTDTTGGNTQRRTLCLAPMGRARVIKGLDTCANG